MLKLKAAFGVRLLLRPWPRPTALLRPRFLPAWAPKGTITPPCRLQGPRGLWAHALTESHELSLWLARPPLVFLTLANGTAVHPAIKVKTKTETKAGLGGSESAIGIVRIVGGVRGKSSDEKDLNISRVNSQGTLEQ